MPNNGHRFVSTGITTPAVCAECEQTKFVSDASDQPCKTKLEGKHLWHTVFWGKLYSGALRCIRCGAAPGVKDAHCSRSFLINAPLGVLIVPQAFD